MAEAEQLLAEAEREINEMEKELGVSTREEAQRKLDKLKASGAALPESDDEDSSDSSDGQEEKMGTRAPATKQSSKANVFLSMILRDASFSCAAAETPGLRCCVNSSCRVRR